MYIVVLKYNSKLWHTLYLMVFLSRLQNTIYYVVYYHSLILIFSICKVVEFIFLDRWYVVVIKKKTNIDQGELQLCSYLDHILIVIATTNRS